MQWFVIVKAFFLALAALEERAVKERDMTVLFAIARVLFSIIFVISGVLKLLDISGTAAIIAAKVTIPAALVGLTTQAETATGMQTPQLLAIAAGGIEFGFGLLLASGFATRFAALVLALFVAVSTFYFHDFWNQADPERVGNIIHAEKNLSIFAGLLVFFVLGRWRPLASTGVDDVYSRREVLREEPLPPL